MVQHTSSTASITNDVVFGVLGHLWARQEMGLPLPLSN